MELQLITSNEIVDNLLQNEKVKYDHSQIEGDLILSGITQSLTISFTNCKILGKIYCKDCSGVINLQVSNSTVSGVIRFSQTHCFIELNKSELQKDILITNTPFSNETGYQCSLKMLGATLHSKVLVTNCVMNQFDMSFINHHTRGSIEFSKITFTDDCKFFGYCFHFLKIEYCTFEKDISFVDGCSMSSIYEMKFSNTSFLGNVEFRYCRVENAIFSGCKFDGIAIFNYFKFGAGKASLQFSSCIFNNDFEMHSCLVTCTFDTTKHYNIALLIACEFEKLVFQKAVFLNGFDVSYSDIKAANRDVYRLLKTEYIKQNNKIEANRFLSLELKEYHKEINIFKNTSEYVMLSLYKYSNNYGLSWERGIFFCFLIGYIFYSCFMLSLKNSPIYYGWRGWANFLQATNIYHKNFFQFMLPTHSINYMDAYGTNSFSYLIDIFSRVLISYGVVQTVTAFRRHSGSNTN